MQIIQTIAGPCLLIDGKLFSEKALREFLPLVRVQAPAKPVNPPVVPFEFKRPLDTEGGAL